jgi:hypothetical protein
MRSFISREVVGTRKPVSVSDADLAQNYGLYLRADIGFSPSLWLDQSINGRNLIQPTLANRPVAVIDSNGFSAVQFDGGLNKYMYYNDATVCQEYTVIIAFSYNATQLANVADIYGNRPWGGGSTVSLFGLNSDFRTLIYQNSVSPSTSFSPSYEDPLEINKKYILSIVVKNNHRYVYLNGYLIQTDLQQQSNLSTRIFSAWIGGENGAAQFGGNIYRIAIWPSALTTDSRITSEYVFMSQLGFSFPISRHIIFDGDSITQAIAPGNSTLVAETKTLLNTAPLARPYKITNVALSGQTIEQMRSEALYQIFPGKQSFSRQPFLLMLGGHNSLKNTDDATTIAEITNYVNQARSFGFRVFVGTLLPALDLAAKETQRQMVNTFIKNTYGTDVIDFASDSDMGQAGQYTNLTYYQVDQIHPNNSGGTPRMATYINSKIKSLI